MASISEVNHTGSGMYSGKRSNYTAPCAVKRAAWQRARSRFNVVASMFVRPDHVASRIVNANHGMM